MMPEGKDPLPAKLRAQKISKYKEREREQQSAMDGKHMSYCGWETISLGHGQVSFLPTFPTCYAEAGRHHQPKRQGAWMLDKRKF